MSYHLYYSPGACSLAPHIVLEEIGAPFELELVWSRGERDGAMTATPAWRAINPKGRIPALRGVPGRMGGAPSLLTEVPAILVYLALRHPEAQLLPAEPSSVARCLEWMNWLSGSVHAMAFGQIWRAHRFSNDEAALPSIRAKGMQVLVDHCTYIEELMGDGREWAIADAYSVVDPYLLVFFRWGERVGLPMRLRYPAWTSATDRTLARAAVQRALHTEEIAQSPVS